MIGAKQTRTGRVVYSRKKHYIEGYDLLRMVLKTSSSWTWDNDSLDYFFLSAMFFSLSRRIRLDRWAGSKIFADQQFIKEIKQAGLRKKWKLYNVLQTHLARIWRNKTLADAWNVFQNVLEAFVDIGDIWDIFQAYFNIIGGITSG